MSEEHVYDGCKAVWRCVEVCVSKCCDSMTQGSIRLMMAVRGLDQRNLYILHVCRRV